MIDGFGQLGGSPLGKAQQALFGTQLDQAKRAQEGGKTEEAANAFEALLAQSLVKELRSSLSEGFFGKGPGADVYESWFDEHLAQSLVDNNALGFAGMVKASIGRIDAAAEAAGATE